mmetsp:Transcript_23892/g.36786  ORF Transcript_23892/g.36786 Transcript_23892/m.36786 type:complete len:271 (+) Transcript_23892:1527-2339(+)
MDISSCCNSSRDVDDKKEASSTTAPLYKKQRLTAGESQETKTTSTTSTITSTTEDGKLDKAKGNNEKLFINPNEPLQNLPCEGDGGGCGSLVANKAVKSSRELSEDDDDSSDVLASPDKNSKQADSSMSTTEDFKETDESLQDKKNRLNRKLQLARMERAKARLQQELLKQKEAEQEEKTPEPNNIVTINNATTCSTTTTTTTTTNNSTNNSTNNRLPDISALQHPSIFIANISASGPSDLVRTIEDYLNYDPHHAYEVCLPIEAHGAVC